MSGSYAAIAEISESAVQLCQNPLLFVDGIQQVATTLASDPGYIDDMIAGMANSIKQQQKLENSYDPYAQETLYDNNLISA